MYTNVDKLIPRNRRFPRTGLGKKEPGQRNGWNDGAREENTQTSRETNPTGCDGAHWKDLLKGVEAGGSQETN